VFFTTRGFWQYFCDELTRGVGFGEVYAYIAYGDAHRHVSNLEAARWRERLDFDAGLRFPVPLDVRLPEPCPAPARIVAGKMRLLVGLRDAHFLLGEPFVFASEFAQAYCDLSPDRVRAGKSWLERARVIHRVGKHGRSTLWQLASQVEANARRHGGDPL
jgi:hypothetical protein